MGTKPARQRHNVYIYNTGAIGKDDRLSKNVLPGELTRRLHLKYH